MDFINVINFAKPGVSGLASIINGLITGCASIAAGIILFTVILKLITFPFDLYSKISMRKNSLKMEEMRPELEKLQEQYANDKVLYNQKMMALYKKNGYSMWGACLPTILTLVIFIVAISAFTDYSNYQNKKYFYDMSLSYNEVIYDGFETDSEIITMKNGKIVIDKEKLYLEIPENEGEKVEYSANSNITIKRDANKTDINGLVTKSFSVQTKNGYTGVTIEYTEEEGHQFGKEYYYIFEDNLATIFPEYSEFTYTPTGSNANEKATMFIKTKARQASAKTYHTNKATFLWVKNLFVADSMFEHPIPASWGNFKGTYGYSDGKTGTMNAKLPDDTYPYDELVYNLKAEKNEYNGYFGLVILTIVTSVVLQIITNKSQKAQMDLQTVDGRSSVTQKVMMWIMPLMMGIFAFFYTSAFSVYIIMSSTISILTTVGTNLILNKKFNKVKSQKASKPIRGRVYVPKEKPKTEKEKKKEAKLAKKNKKNKLPENDFLSGMADKKGKKKKFKNLSK